jgi:serine/threonine protein phosphatase PrpC
MKVRLASFTEPGPRSVNEDFVDAWELKSGVTVACIADGLGGMGGGDFASKLAAREFKSSLFDAIISDEAMRDAAGSSHEAIRREQHNNPSSRMATTFTAVAIVENEIFGVHCGDSRAVIARGSGIKRLTVDHSEGQRLYDAGKISKEELFDYPRKHILESALGGKDEPRIDTFRFSLLSGDRIYLTTDGVHQIVLLREMQALGASCSSPEDLVARVGDLIKERGASDNYSMLSIFID